VSGEEVPAVTVPFCENAGFNAASPAAVVSGRMQPSVSTVPVLVTMGTISALK
jgi:hypothetical protein